MDGDVIAFGGDHFVYRVTLQKPAESEPTVTQLLLKPAIDEAADTDKTTFVAAAHSFLDIFCVDPALQREDEVNVAAQAASAHAKREASGSAANGAQGANGANGAKAANARGSSTGWPQRWRLLAQELSHAFTGGERAGTRRIAAWGGAALVLVVAISMALYLRGSSERELKNLLASGDYTSAVAAANNYLTQHPADTKVSALASEATAEGQSARVAERAAEGAIRRCRRATQGDEIVECQ